MTRENCKKVNTSIFCDNDEVPWWVVEKYDDVVSKIERDYKIEVHTASNKRITLYREHIVSVMEVLHEQS